MERTEKTALEWFKTLPSLIRDKAIANVNKQHSKGDVDSTLQCLHDSLDDAINYSFTWNKTPEGQDFWSELANFGPAPTVIEEDDFFLLTTPHT